jgi:bifunctional NMN adenylyltransferase/nudix hydrolase
VTTQPYDYAVFIGRFQPYHAGHHHVALEALKISKNLIFVLGSHDAPRSARNPYTTSERMAIIHGAFDKTADGILKERDKPRDLVKFKVRDEERESFIKRVHFAPQVDHCYNEERWIAGIQSAVTAIVHNKFTPDPVRICLVGYDKDHSSFYLKKFPQWETIQIRPKADLSATGYRNRIFASTLDDSGHIDDLVDGFWTNDWRVTEMHGAMVAKYTRPIHKQISEEMAFLKKYREGFAKAPYPPTFVTVDTVVTASGHILLVKRGASPGKGLWALPGGFVNQYETLKDAAIRELREETQLKVPIGALYGSIAKEHTYDDPYRSQRGRTITHCYHLKLRDDEDLPKIKGADDAEKAFWLPLSEFVQSRSKLFEDHFCIVSHMLGI